MAGFLHTYGPTCQLARTVESSGLKGEDEIPSLRAHFFYSSPLPIDDPLSVIPSPVDSDSKNTKYSPRPFSAFDNYALENAWKSLASKKDRKHHNKTRLTNLKPLTKAQAERRTAIISELVTKHAWKHSVVDGTQDRPQTKVGSKDDKSAKGKASIGSDVTVSGVSNESCSGSQSKYFAYSHSARTQKGIPREDSYDTVCDNLSDDPAGDLPVVICCAELEKDVKSAQPQFTGVIKWRESKAHREMLIQDIVSQVTNQKSSFATADEQSRKQEARMAQGDAPADILYTEGNKNSRMVIEEFKHKSKDINPAVIPAIVEEFQPKEHELHKPAIDHKHVNIRPKVDSSARAGPSAAKRIASLNSNINEEHSSPGNAGTGLTGSPFKRAPSRKQVSFALYEEPTVEEYAVPADHDAQYESIHLHRCKAHTPHKADPEVPVGVSGLHLVKLPALRMTPIYWSPVHDVAAVARGTWFYSSTMYPVEPAVANQLEAGYRELRPWSETWSDELKSAIEVGAAGEEKVSYRLWPENLKRKASGNDYSPMDFPNDQLDLVTDPYCAARCFHGEVAAAGSTEDLKTTEKLPATAEIMKRYPNSHIIYKDTRHAFILKPSLQPSVYFGRKPVAKILKGLIVGIPVVRGFEWKTWDKLHPSTKNIAAKNAEEAAANASTASNKTRAAIPKSACPGCLRDDDRIPATDLVLVIHGIGQKLSERMESFHFTHAVNSFRRSVNVELGNEAVRKVLRPNLGGVMVLPVNWRSNLTFEEGGPSKVGDEPKRQDPEDFNLQDITPDTIPAVRNLISDVLLDIPYYLSQHKPRMIEALILEANRIYRLWCHNNPDFMKHGRVHLIAHSLGSAMALDVLSKQPTSVEMVDPSKKVQKKYFEFNTTNLFLAGSPAGFFLLLDKGKLIPRNGKKKPGADPLDDNGEDITGQAGVFGCLAVDNLYNVMHYNDPIAYRLNATVDPKYAASLKSAELPISTIGWLETVGNVFRVFTPSASSTQDGFGIGQLAPKPPVARLPSQLEMEVHDFTREEIVEKKFYLLNDNGQIDYFLARDGGPLEIQYLNMLGAHSSYWTSPDFIRMLVIEVGRKPGKAHAMPNMKAVKISYKGKRSEK